MFKEKGIIIRGCIYVFDRVLKFVIVEELGIGDKFLVFINCFLWFVF